MLPQAPVSPLNVPLTVPMLRSGSEHQTCVPFSYVRVTLAEFCAWICVSLSASLRLDQLSPVAGFVNFTLNAVNVDVPRINVTGRSVETVGRERIE